jgi:hypothetical protein
VLLLVELVEHLAVDQIVVVVAEIQEVDTLLAVETAYKPVYHTEHSIGVL